MENQIGKGAYGNVFKCKPTNPKSYAFKVFNDFREKDVMDQLMEYDILKKIPFHKNIIPLHNLYLFNRANARVIPVLQYELAETSLDNEISLRKGQGNRYTPAEC